MLPSPTKYPWRTAGAHWQPDSVGMAAEEADEVRRSDEEMDGGKGSVEQQGTAPFTPPDVNASSTQALSTNGSAAPAFGAASDSPSTAVSTTLIATSHPPSLNSAPSASVITAAPTLSMPSSDAEPGEQKPKSLFARLEALALHPNTDPALRIDGNGYFPYPSVSGRNTTKNWRNKNKMLRKVRLVHGRSPESVPPVPETPAAARKERGPAPESESEREEGEIREEADSPPRKKRKKRRSGKTKQPEEQPEEQPPALQPPSTLATPPLLAPAPSFPPSSRSSGPAPTLSAASSAFLPHLAAFLASIDSSLASLAEPLTLSGIASLCLLAAFSSFEQTTRIALYEEVEETTGTRVTKEQIEFLERACGAARGASLVQD